MSKELNKVFGNNLRKRRKELRLTQTEVAEKLNISASFYANIERGNRFVSLDVLDRLSKVLNISIGRLFEERQNNTLLDNINDMLRICSQDNLQTVEKILEVLIVSFMQAEEGNKTEKN